MLSLLYSSLLKFVFYNDYRPNLSVTTLHSVLYAEFRFRGIFPLSVFFDKAHDLPEQLWIISIVVIATISYSAINSIKYWAQLLQNKIHLETMVSGYLTQLQKELDSVQRLRSRMQRRSAIHLATIASISHDIKAPIGFITQSARQINDSIDRNEMDRIAKAGEVISYTSDKIFHLVDGLSEFLRNDIHEEISNEEISLANLVSDKISTFSEIIAAHNGKISIKIRSEEVVFTNAKLLGVVIHNLIDNAIKAEFSNHITFSTKELDGKLHFIISDTGPGMPEQVVEFLNNDTLEPDGDNNRFQLHLGLGIILVREVCHLLDLDLAVFNESGAHIHIIFSDNIYYNGNDKWLS